MCWQTRLLLTAFLDLMAVASLCGISATLLVWWVAWFFKLRPAGFRGNSRSGVYHLQGCEWVQKVRPASTVRFFSCDDAEVDGFRPCSFCRPRHVMESQPDNSARHQFLMAVSRRFGLR